MCDPKEGNSEEVRKKFEKLSEPLIEFLNDHYHPHASIIVTTTTAEVLSGEICHSTGKFIKD